MKNKIKKTFVGSFSLALSTFLLALYLMEKGFYLEFFGIDFDEFFQALFLFSIVVFFISSILFLQKKALLSLGLGFRNII